MRFNRMYKRLSYPCAAEGLRLKTRKGARRTTSTEKRRLTDRTSNPSAAPPRRLSRRRGCILSRDIDLLACARTLVADVSELVESG